MPEAVTFHNLTEAVIAARQHGDPTDDPQVVLERIAELQQIPVEQVLAWRPMHAIRITIQMMDTKL